MKKKGSRCADVHSCRLQIVDNAPNHRFPLHPPQRRYVTSSTKVMASQPGPGAITLPRSLLDTDLYKARIPDTSDDSCFERTVNTAIIFSNSSLCSRPCCITSPRPKQLTSSLTAMPTDTSPASVTSNSSRLYLVRTLSRFCSYISL